MKYPIGIQSFQKLIEGGYTYIDKTAMLLPLVQSDKSYFFSRPRRFGKSLLLSTFEAIFLGKKALFSDLAISQLEYNWETYPVLKLEFTKRKVNNAGDLEELLLSAISELSKRYDIELNNQSSALRFNELVKAIVTKQGKPVVLLIDEYDKPILDCLNMPEYAQVKSALNGFYAMVKTLDEYLRFTFITGVSKFSQVSVFSGMNNLVDLSMDRRYATLCGYTESEMTSAFRLPLNQLAKNSTVTDLQVIEKVRQWYNGYCFHPEAEKVYNPHSVLSLLDKQEFKSYWYQSATPTFLINLIKDKDVDLTSLETFEVGENTFSAVDPEEMDVLAVLLQTGYLTIKSYDAPLYQMGFPNKEVQDSFYDSLAASYSNQSSSLTQAYAVKMHRALGNRDLNEFFYQLNIFFANVSYDIALKHEKYYQSLIFVICKLLGFTADVEVTTSNGRIDAVIQSKDVFFIIEFKLNGSKDEALQQIKHKSYAQKYIGLGKDIVLVGVEFSHEQRNIGGWVEEGLVLCR